MVLKNKTILQVNKWLVREWEGCMEKLRVRKAGEAAGWELLSDLRWPGKASLVSDIWVWKEVRIAMQKDGGRMLPQMKQPVQKSATGHVWNDQGTARRPVWLESHEESNGSSCHSVSRDQMTEDLLGDWILTFIASGLGSHWNILSTGVTRAGF